MSKARFIAGAVCPQCQIADRLVIEQVSGQTRRRCVSCGFNDGLVETQWGGVPRGKPEKRTPTEPESQTIKLFDPNSDSN